MANAQLCIKLLSSESSLLFHSTLEGVFSQRSLEMRATQSCSPEDSLKPHPKEAHPVGSGMAQEFLVLSSLPQVILIMETLAPEQTVWSELLQASLWPGADTHSAQGCVHRGRWESRKRTSLGQRHVYGHSGCPNYLTENFGIMCFQAYVLVTEPGVIYDTLAEPGALARDVRPHYPVTVAGHMTTRGPHSRVTSTDVWSGVERWTN